VFDYTVTSQSVNPTPPAPAPTVEINNNNVRAQIISNIHSRIFINAWQRSSTNFTNGLATSTIDYVNTSQTFAAYSTSPGVTAGVQNIQMITNPRPFVACIVQNSAVLHGFSFQFFGGYQGGFNYTMRVWVTRGNVRQTPELQITFTTSVGTTTRGLLDGTFAYIPFQQNVIQTPTHVSNVVYTGSLPTVQLGDFVRVSLTGSESSGNGVIASILTTQLIPISGNRVNGPMLGSLLIDGVPPQIQVTNNSASSQIIQANASLIIFSGVTITNATPLALIFIRMSYIEIWNVTPTMQSPYRMRVTIFVSDGPTAIYNCEIVICITASVARGQLIGNFLQAIDIPFNMPRPTDIRSADGDPTNRYFIESFNPVFNPDFFSINTNGDVSTATHSFPRIFRGPTPPTSQLYNYVINVANMEGSGEIRIVENTTLIPVAGSPLGTGVTCQLGWINNLPLNQ
jgi:hypothetical protein